MSTTAIILTPLALEKNAVIEFLENVTPLQNLKARAFKGSYSFQGNQLEVVVIETGSTIANVTDATTEGILVLKPKIVVLTGIAGAISDDLQILDVAIGTSAMDYTYAAEKDNETEYRTNVINYDHDLVKIAKDVGENNIWRNRVKTSGGERSTAIAGIIASGNTVLKSHRGATYLFLKKSKVLAVEMESHGVATSVQGRNIPAINIRAISDLVKDKEASDKHGNQFLAAKIAATFVFCFLEEWYTRLENTSTEGGEKKTNKPSTVQEQNDESNVQKSENTTMGNNTNANTNFLNEIKEFVNSNAEDKVEQVEKHLKSYAKGQVFKDAFELWVKELNVIKAVEGTDAYANYTARRNNNGENPAWNLHNLNEKYFNDNEYQSLRAAVCNAADGKQSQISDETVFNRALNNLRQALRDDKSKFLQKINEAFLDEVKKKLGEQKPVVEPTAIIKPKPSKIEVFIAYAREDEKHKKSIKEKLAEKIENNLVEIIDDSQIPAGAEWDRWLQEKLGECNVMLLLISKAFFQSTYISKTELPAAIVGHETNKKRVIPIILEACEWQKTWVGKLQALSDISTTQDQDTAYTNVVEGLRKVVAALKLPKRNDSYALGLVWFCVFPSFLTTVHNLCVLEQTWDWLSIGLPALIFFGGIIYLITLLIARK